VGSLSYVVSKMSRHFVTERMYPLYASVRCTSYCLLPGSAYPWRSDKSDGISRQLEVAEPPEPRLPLPPKVGVTRCAAYRDLHAPYAQAPPSQTEGVDGFKEVGNNHIHFRDVAYVLEILTTPFLTALSLPDGRPMSGARVLLVLPHLLSKGWVSCADKKFKMSYR
jgi:hypothetical protein